ncbi:MAG TPA: hypothetical protein PLG14_03285, partial [Spirochaetales bacterium]|nr:hypothetical protein [Spirochaetales bacterium]
MPRRAGRRAAARGALPAPFILLAFLAASGLAVQAAAQAAGGGAITGGAARGGAAAARPELPPGRALLLRGPEPRKGLPFFSPNAIPALVGEYEVSKSLVRVWSSRSPLSFGKSWESIPIKLPASLRALRLARDGGPVIALAGPDYSLFFELPADTPAFRSFLAAFERRFAFFFEGAPTDAEL